MNPIEHSSPMDTEEVQVVSSDPKWKITTPPLPLDTQISRGGCGRAGDRRRTLGTAKSREDAQRAEFPQDSATLSGSAVSRRMLGVALGIGVLLALVGCTAAEGCVAPQDMVSQLLQRLEGSVNLEEAANPSVLLAMNLAGGDSDGPVHKWLLQEIKEEAVRSAQKDMTSGQVALHVLALLSSCQDPQRVHALEQTLDLIRVLQQKTDEEMAKLEAEGVPKTTLYSVALDTMALCLAEASGAQGPSVALAKQVLSPQSHLSVGTRAMVALALSCIYNYVELQDVRELLQEALWTVSNSFLDEQEKRNGMIGNIYSMGLALQALEATRKFYAPRKWDCAQAFSVVYAHNYQQPMAMAQVLPALVGRSYLDAAGLDCAATKDMSPSQQLALFPKLGTHGVPRGMLIPPGVPQTPLGGRSHPVPGAPLSHLESPRRRREDVPTLCQVPSRLLSPCTASIQVYYSITNTLQGKHFNYSTTVTVPRGSTLLRVMEVAAEENPQTSGESQDDFGSGISPPTPEPPQLSHSFQTEQTSWGPYVTSIHGLAGSTDDRTYWHFLSAGNALEEGVGTYKPHDREHIQAVFSTY
ncbi:PREDICTED: LOW QUALITY PROTEIN: transcobalamin-1-like [Ficedula albicollis]|uniref:LOW QUALITY PROTEIN: transcobalamin-1-like n=1 Tax=Ficedula albicollis TaxID=59894 RepID=UPI0007AD8C08|nr:PREDICTED: LOW QUALITY PROTEIN: transcobalamin-1-like [Ficedula albicollis]